MWITWSQEASSHLPPELGVDRQFIIADVVLIVRALSRRVKLKSLCLCTRGGSGLEYSTIKVCHGDDDDHTPIGGQWLRMYFCEGDCENWHNFCFCLLWGEGALSLSYHLRPAAVGWCLWDDAPSTYQLILIEDLWRWMPFSSEDCRLKLK